MKTRFAAPLQLGILLLTGGLLVQAASAGVFPKQPTVNDEVFAVLKYPCPYPDSDNPPVIKRDNGVLTMEATTNGTVCFDHELIDRDYAYNLGKFQPGKYKLSVQHRYRLGNGRPSEFFWTNVAVREFEVVEGVPDRISGIWASNSRARDGFSITVMDPQTVYVTWNTNSVDGDPLWLYGTLLAKGSVLEGIMYQNRGLKFGESRADASSAVAWGSLELHLQECGSLRAVWKTLLPGYTNGEAQLGLLSNPRGVEGCLPDARFGYGTRPLPIQQ